MHHFFIIVLPLLDPLGAAGTRPFKPL